MPLPARFSMMIPHPDTSRTAAYGQDYSPTLVDTFGTWLSWRRLSRALPDRGYRARLGDFGSGYHAALTRRALPRISGAVVVDLRLSEDLKSHPQVRAIEGSLPSALDVLASDSLDVIVCNSVVEHLWRPEETLSQFYRLLAPGGCCLINVPSWRGRRFLEFSAFRLGLSPADEMNDHKNYYDPRDLWPLLVRAGFLPFDIHCGLHKFGLNTFAHCRKPSNTPTVSGRE
jgi:SAM-dependent methyltransferase